MLPRLRAAMAGAAAGLCVLTVAGTACAAPLPTGPVPSILGGTPVTNGSLPFLAFVAGQFADGTGESCSGTVVAPDLVLTAGHCAENPQTGHVYPPGDLSVITGRDDLLDDSVGQELTVTHTYIEPAYDPPAERDDAALLQLGRQTTAPPVELAVDPDFNLIQPGAAGWVAGWGLTSPTATHLNTQLQQTPETVLPVDNCLNAWGSLYDTDSEMCASGPAGVIQGTCNGDSGGPLFESDDGVPTEVGLATYVALGCDTRVPDVFTRSDDIAGWAERLIVAHGNEGIPAISDVVARMTRAVAIVHSRIVLRRLFGNSVKHNSQLTDTCTRIQRSAFLCTTAWARGGTAYSGSVTVAYELEGDQQQFDVHTAIHRVLFQPAHVKAKQV